VAAGKGCVTSRVATGAAAGGGATDEAAAGGGATDEAAAGGGATDEAAAGGGATDAAAAGGGATDAAAAGGGATDAAATTGGGATDGGFSIVMGAMPSRVPLGRRLTVTAGIGAVTVPGSGAGVGADAATGPDVSAPPASSQKAWKLSASRSASSTLSGDDGRPLSGGSGIDCSTEASIAARRGATRGSRWFGRFAKGTLRAAQAACDPQASRAFGAR